MWPTHIKDEWHSVDHRWTTSGQTPLITPFHTLVDLHSRHRCTLVIDSTTDFEGKLAVQTVHLRCINIKDPRRNTSAPANSSYLTSSKACAVQNASLTGCRSNRRMDARRRLAQPATDQLLPHSSWSWLAGRETACILTCQKCASCIMQQSFDSYDGSQNCLRCFEGCQVLHPVAELPILCHVLRAVQGAQHSDITVVVSPQSATAIQQVHHGCHPGL